MERNRNGYFLYEEKVFGAAKNREQFQKVLEDLQKSDIIYFTNLTRITRST
jgi:DNA invertase Pin-like site-specific DNA recombinase